MARSARKIVGVVLFSFLLYLLFPRQAYAYLDPATGSYITQIVIAAVIGGLFAIKQYSYKIKTFFKNRFPKKEALDEDEQ